VADGTVRADMEPEDVFRAMSVVFIIPADGDWSERAQRHIQLVMDGLRFGVSAT
jgi:hypothetical protein